MNDRLETQRIPSLLFALSVPAICAQIVTLLYNLADRIYIGRMADGAMAMAGIGICTPLISIITAFTGLLGRGGAPLAAISLGERNQKQAERFIGNGFSLLVCTSVLMMALLLGFHEQLLRMFGASERTLPYAADYLRVYCVGTVFIQLTVGMNYYITTQGFARTAMITTMTGGILNIILDPLLIFGLNMGVKGAAWATVLSQGASCIWVMCFLFGKTNRLRIRMRNLWPGWKTLRRILILGASPFFMSASEGLLHICFNMQALRYGGDLAVSAMTILFSMFQFLLLPVEGVAQGSQPIIGHNLGAKRYDRVQETIRLTIRVNFLIAFVGCLAMLIVPEAFIRIFTGDAELVRLGGRMLRVYIFGCLVVGINSTCQQTYNSMGEGGHSFFFAFYRKVILLIPLLYILPRFLDWGIMAVVLAEPVSDWITTLTNIVCFRRFLKKRLADGGGQPA